MFVRVNPLFLRRVTPLVAISVSAAITASFETYINERLDWLDIVLGEIQLEGDEDVREVAPKIMDVLSQRLQGAYMTVSEARPNDPVLRRLVGLNRRTGEIRKAAT